MMYPEKRELDGIYIRVKRDGKTESLCLSDCESQERYGYLKRLTNEQLDRVDRHIVDCFKAMLPLIDLKDATPEKIENIAKDFESKFMIGSWSYEIMHAINTDQMIKSFRSIAERCGITRCDPEENS